MRAAGRQLSQQDAPATAPSTHAPAPATAGWQRQLGNQNLQRLLAAGAVQAKLRVSQPQDADELEADRVAAQVMRMPAARGCAACAGGASPCAKCEDDDLVRRKADTAAPAAADVRVLRLPDAGAPLPASVRDFFEPRFGRDLGDVRVHTGTQAAVSAQSVNARAFTFGRHVVFNAGEYAPQSTSGRQLLAHELVHTIQQRRSDAIVQRACNTARISGRTEPVYFPQEADILSVYRGASTLSSSAVPSTAVGLVQQALVDLGHNLGTGGPNADGVTRVFGPDTASAVTAFQTAETITTATADTVDQPTLQCLDDKRSLLSVPSHLTGSVFPTQVRIDDAARGGRDEDIFFDRGSFALDAAGRAKIGRLLTRAVNPLQGCAVTLEGFSSEDELVELGPSLATRRINAVNAEFASQRHDDPGPVCTSPVLPLRTPSPLPAASSGVSDYRHRRKVEVVPAGASSTTAPCPPGAVQFRALTVAEGATLTAAIDLAVVWINTALGELTPGDPQGNAALRAYFGGTTRRGVIRTNLIAWRDHLDTHVRVNNRHGTQCNAPCRTAIAFNQGSGAAAQMTVCPRFFQPMSVHPSLTQAQKEAFVMLHEAGHGSIRTRDTGYGHRRLIEFLASFPAVAETNTDSYTLMVLCLNSFPGFCLPPTTVDTAVGMSVAERTKSRRGLAWLQTWLMWAEQDTSSLYGQMNTARESGRGILAVNSYYAGVYDELVRAFNIHRPAADPSPTFGEQTMVAAILDRIGTMEDATRAGLTVEKDTSVTPVDRWDPGPGRSVFLTDRYFTLGTDRTRVEFLLPLILRANSRITRALEPVYETYIKENVRANRRNLP